MSMSEKGKSGGSVLVKWIVICIVAGFIGSFGMPALAAQQAEDTVTVNVNAPAYVEETFNAAIDVDSVTGFNSGQFDPSFNSSVVNVTDATTSDSSNGNYIFENLPAGNYTVVAFQDHPFAGWIIGRTNVTVCDSLLPDVNISLSKADANGINEINELLNKTISPEGTGSGVISGTLHAASPFGVVTVPGATVVLIKEKTVVAPEPLFAQTTSDSSNGNYIFENLPAGNYTVVAFQDHPFAGWIIGRTNVTVCDSLLPDVNISLSKADANGINEINELLNKTISPEGTGSGVISGTLHAASPFGVVTVPGATVVLIKEMKER